MFKRSDDTGKSNRGAGSSSEPRTLISSMSRFLAKFKRSGEPRESGSAITPASVVPEGDALRKSVSQSQTSAPSVSSDRVSQSRSGSESKLAKKSRVKPAIRRSSQAGQGIDSITIVEQRGDSAQQGNPCTLISLAVIHAILSRDAVQDLPELSSLYQAIEDAHQLANNLFLYLRDNGVISGDGIEEVEALNIFNLMQELQFAPGDDTKIVGLSEAYLTKETHIDLPREKVLLRTPTISEIFRVIESVRGTKKHLTETEFLKFYQKYEQIIKDKFGENEEFKSLEFWKNIDLSTLISKERLSRPIAEEYLNLKQSLQRLSEISPSGMTLLIGEHTISITHKDNKYYLYDSQKGTLKLSENLDALVAHIMDEYGHDASAYAGVCHWGLNRGNQLQFLSISHPTAASLGDGVLPPPSSSTLPTQSSADSSHSHTPASPASSSTSIPLMLDADAVTAIQVRKNHCQLAFTNALEPIRAKHFEPIAHTPQGSETIHSSSSSADLPTPEAFVGVDEIKFNEIKQKLVDYAAMVTHYHESLSSSQPGVKRIDALTPLELSMIAHARQQVFDLPNLPAQTEALLIDIYKKDLALTDKQDELKEKIELAKLKVSDYLINKLESERQARRRQFQSKHKGVDLKILQDAADYIHVSEFMAESPPLVEEHLRAKTEELNQLREKAKIALEVLRPTDTSRTVRRSSEPELYGILSRRLDDEQAALTSSQPSRLQVSNKSLSRTKSAPALREKSSGHQAAGSSSQASVLPKTPGSLSVASRLVRTQSSMDLVDQKNRKHSAFSNVNVGFGAIAPNLPPSETFHAPDPTKPPTIQEMHLDPSLPPSQNIFNFSAGSVAQEDNSSLLAPSDNTPLPSSHDEPSKPISSPRSETTHLGPETSQPEHPGSSAVSIDDAEFPDTAGQASHVGGSLDESTKLPQNQLHETESDNEFLGVQDLFKKRVDVSFSGSDTSSDVSSASDSDSNSPDSEASNSSDFEITLSSGTLSASSTESTSSEDTPSSDTSSSSSPSASSSVTSDSSDSDTNKTGIKQDKIKSPPELESEGETGSDADEEQETPEEKQAREQREEAERRAKQEQEEIIAREREAARRAKEAQEAAERLAREAAERLARQEAERLAEAARLAAEEEARRREEIKRARDARREELAEDVDLDASVLFGDAGEDVLLDVDSNASVGLHAPLLNEKSFDFNAFRQQQATGSTLRDHFGDIEGVPLQASCSYGPINCVPNSSNPSELTFEYTYDDGINVNLLNDLYEQNDLQTMRSDARNSATRPLPTPRREEVICKQVNKTTEHHLKGSKSAEAPTATRCRLALAQIGHQGSQLHQDKGNLPRSAVCIITQDFSDANAELLAKTRAFEEAIHQGVLPLLAKDDLTKVCQKLKTDYQRSPERYLTLMRNLGTLVHGSTELPANSIVKQFIEKEYRKLEGLPVVAKQSYPTLLGAAPKPQILEALQTQYYKHIPPEVRNELPLEDVAGLTSGG